MSKRIIRINASALKQSACFLHFYRTVIEGYKEPVSYNYIEFGSAIHIFIKHMYTSGGKIDESIWAAKNYFDNTKMLIDPRKKYMDSFHLMRVCMEVWEWIQSKDDVDVLSGEDGKPLVEVTFSNLFYSDDKYEVYLEGTIDRIGKIRGGGVYCIPDWKSTSAWDKEEYLANYANSVQLKFYYYNLHLYAKLHPDSFIAEMCKYPIGCFINGIFLNGKDKTEMIRSEIFLFKEEQMKVFVKLLDITIQRLLAYLNMIDTPPAPEGLINGACTSTWGKCKFFNVCATEDTITKQHLLKNGFIQEEYQPLKNRDNE